MRPLASLLVFLCLALPRAAHPQSGAEHMERLLQERDLVIRNLQQRIEALERRLDAAPAAPIAARASARQPDSSNLDEDETARALERALVREGGFLLPPRAFEIEPRLLYTYRGVQGLGLIPSPGGVQIADRDVRQDRYEASLGLRVGLPRSTQASIRLPYVYTHAQNAAAALALSESERRSGMGDIELQLSKQFVGERLSGPAVLGSLTWKPATGESDFGRLSVGSGFPSLQAAVTAVKRQDPVVFFTGLSYTAFRSRAFDGSDVRPGNGIGLRFGAILAASPETSLRAGLDLNRNQATRLNGRSVPGSEVMSAVVELGLSTLVFPNTLLDLRVGFGVTPDAPDLRIGVALPIRFR